MAVTKFDMNFIVATSAQTHQVAFCVRTASVDGQDVVNFFHGRQPPFCKASLAKRMRLDIPYSYPLPFTPIFLVVVGRTLIFVVAVRRLAFMFVAIGLVRKVGTARKCARLLRFMWHTVLQKNALKFYAHFKA